MDDRLRARPPAFFSGLRAVQVPGGLSGRPLESEKIDLHFLVSGAFVRRLGLASIFGNSP